jgi:multicomponent K+:H+ antiporter subunit E
MRRLWPSPLLSAGLLLAWLMLNGSVSAAQVLLGALLSTLLPLLTDGLRPDRPTLRRPCTIARLALVVLQDIVLSNIELARRVLGPEDAVQPRFVWVPLDLRSAHGIVALAGIISLTPGTLSAELSDDRNYLLVHAFNVADEAALVRHIKARYEAPLREIFE